MNNLEKFLSQINNKKLQTCIKQSEQQANMCSECDRKLRIINMKYECPLCKNITDIEDDNVGVDIYKARQTNVRFRISGADSRKFQVKMDNVFTVSSEEHQQKTIYAELLSYNKKYEDRGGNPIPKNILLEVTRHYNQIQKIAVKRNKTKKEILAALIKQVCINHDFIKSSEEVTEFVELPTHSIASGLDYLRKISEENKIDINMNKCQILPYINTIFANLSVDKKYHKTISGIVREIIDISKKKYIGLNSVLRSKIISIIIDVLQRLGVKVNLIDVTKKCSIRIHTIKQFLNVLYEYHEEFVHIYKKYKIFDGDTEWD